TDVLNGNFDASLIHNRIVLIGAVAESLKDFIQTPYDTHINGYAAQTPGVIVHANIASQIVNAALNGRPLLRVLPEPLEWLWILAWSVIGVFIGFTFLQVQLFKRSGLPKFVVVVIYTSISISTLILSSYAAFLLGWWTTAIAPATALIFSGLAVMLNNNRQLEELAFIDGLTRVANRRYFDRYLAEEWELGKRQTQQQISLILCDVDYFKFYNDHYGHQAGDRCLQQVAQAIAKATRKSDLVARYGGEEFVVILPKTNQENATHVAERMLQQVISLNIPHAKSQVKNCITVSCGVASVKVSPAYNPKDLIAAADQALYTAKKQGRASYWAVSLNS
ncbi:MAG: diguanylate cyclase, partial [Cyanobacteria bacterium J083]